MKYNIYIGYFGYQFPRANKIYPVNMENGNSYHIAEYDNKDNLLRDITNNLIDNFYPENDEDYDQYVNGYPRMMDTIISAIPHFDEPVQDLISELLINRIERLTLDEEFQIDAEDGDDNAEYLSERYSDAIIALENKSYKDYIINRIITEY